MNKFESLPIVRRFREQINTLPESPAPHVICGVSGGVDSMSLLYLLHRHDVKTTVVHCNYGVRGENSDKEQQLVEEVCSMWGIDCVSVRLDADEAKGRNFQAWARERRYRVFRDLKRELNADFIATAHHQDDQVETIFQKILRGSGPISWQGMAVVDGDLFRPLLGVRKEEIRKFAKEQHVPFREDESNFSSDYARNFLRRELKQRMDEFFPGWQKNILALPDRVKDFEGLANELLKRMKSEAGGLKRDELLRVDQKLWPVLLLQFLKEELPYVAHSTGFLEEVKSLKTVQTGSGLAITNNIQLVRDRDRFVLVKKREDLNQQAVVGRGELKEAQKIGDITVSTATWDGTLDTKNLLLDVEKIEWPLKIRNWSEGDTIRPLGLDGKQTVAKLLTNKKISSVEKKRAKVIESFDGTICAVIFPHMTKNGQTGVISELVKCTSRTKEIVRIEN